MVEKITHPNALSNATGYKEPSGEAWRVSVAQGRQGNVAVFEVFRYRERHRAVARLIDAWRAERDALKARAEELQAQADSLARAIGKLEKQGKGEV